MIPPLFTVPRQIIYIILNPTYFTALYPPPLKPIRSPSPEPRGRDFPSPPNPCSDPGAGAAPGRAARAGGSPGAGEKDTKGKRRKRRWQGVELLLLQGLGVSGGCPPSCSLGHRHSSKDREAELGQGGSVQKQGLEF